MSTLRDVIESVKRAEKKDEIDMICRSLFDCIEMVGRADNDAVKRQIQVNIMRLRALEVQL